MREPHSELARYGAATIYEASGKQGMLDPLIRPVWHGARVCGPARCIRSSTGDNLALHLALTRTAVTRRQPQPMSVRPVHLQVR